MHKILLIYKEIHLVTHQKTHIFHNYKRGELQYINKKKYLGQDSNLRPPAPKVGALTKITVYKTY